MNETIGVVGIGRMGRGIALSYIFAGVPVLLVDTKERGLPEREALYREAREELSRDLQFLADVGLMQAPAIAGTLELVAFTHRADGAELLGACSIVYEGVPEVMAAKTEAFSYISDCVAHDAIIASTTSTFLVTELAGLVTHPQRFINAHWLNPAHLMPLVELSRSEQTSEQVVATMVASLEAIGKVPVVCSASPGYIVPRIQALAMNEAARLVEEGVASAEDVDKAVTTGFGLRFAVLGLLEFIDWGGGDILHYASGYLSNTIGERFTAPDIIGEHMREGKNGLRDGGGFFEYRDIDADDYRRQRMSAFVALLQHRNLLPVHRPAPAE